MMRRLSLHNAKHIMWAILLLFISTLSVAVPIVGSAIFIKKIYYPDNTILLSDVNGNNDRVIIPKSQDVFSATDLITIVLSSVSVILTAVTIALAILGLFGYRMMILKAEEEARRIAEENSGCIAKEVAEDLVPRFVASYIKARDDEASSYKSFTKYGHKRNA